MTGKTTLAKELESRGYQLLNYTDVLKEVASEMLHTVGHHVTVADINQNKERYRPYLQSVGALLDFNGGYGIPELMTTWDGTSPVVFDNVRYDAQADILREYGFSIVELWLDNSVRKQRSQSTVSWDDTAETQFVHCDVLIDVYARYTDAIADQLEFLNDYR